MTEGVRKNDGGGTPEMRTGAGGGARRGYAGMTADDATQLSGSGTPSWCEQAVTQPPGLTAPTRANQARVLGAISSGSCGSTVSR